MTRLVWNTHFALTSLFFVGLVPITVVYNAHRCYLDSVNHGAPSHPRLMVTKEVLGTVLLLTVVVYTWYRRHTTAYLLFCFPVWLVALAWINNLYSNSLLDKGEATPSALWWILPLTILNLAFLCGAQKG